MAFDLYDNEESFFGLKCQGFFSLENYIISQNQSGTEKLENS